MKNTGITYTSAERSPVILPEMAELLPPLSAEQLDALEADLIKNGCYSPIIVNEDMVIIDGHNRQALCEKHGLPYTMAVFSFEDTLVLTGTGRSVIRGRGRESIAPSRTLPAKEKKPKKWRMER